MNEHVTHIEVYLNKDNKVELSYEIEDNGEVLFSPFLLRECINDFYIGDENIARKISSEELKKRVKIMRTQLAIIPTDIEFKISRLIQHISQNESNYQGIRIIGGIIE